MRDYAELVNGLKNCVNIPCNEAQKEKCLAGRENDCRRELMAIAADAIEELSAKATPKRVGFSGWKGCRDTRYKCPYCNKCVRNDDEYCHKCGQSLMFPHISHTPYIPGEKQEVIVTWPDEPTKEDGNA